MNQTATLRSLLTSVDAEIISRLNVAPLARDAAKRDNAALAEQYVILADLVEAKALLTALDDNSWRVSKDSAEDFARGALRDAGVLR